MAGAGFKTFTAGEVLTASDVNTYLQEQTVMNFAGTAARASALPSPSAGMVSHIGGGTVEVYDGSTWVDIAPTPVSDSGLVLIDEESFSAVSSVSLNNVFSATYQNYRIIFNLSAASTSSNMNVRLRASGTDDTGANYLRAIWYRQIGGSFGSADTINGTTWVFSDYNSSYASYYTFSMDLLNPFNTAYTTGLFQNNMMNSSNFLFGVAGNVQHGSTSSYDGITFYGSLGTISGKVRIYGYKGA